MNTKATEQFRDAIRAAGMTVPGSIQADGKLHRFAPNGTRGDDAGWYVLHDNGIPAGAYGNWRTTESQTWRADIGRKLTRAEAAAHHAKVDAMQREREAEENKNAAAARQRAMSAWVEAKDCEVHPYLTRKGIAAHGARLIGADLVMPLRDTEGVIHSLQTITPDGEKRFMAGGRVKGCYFSIGTLKGAKALCICEGFATGASIHEATQHPVAVAFNAGNLHAVATAVRGKFPELALIVCADDDYCTDGNPGVTKGTEAARAVGGLLAIPNFGTDRPEGATDFNDMVKHRGAEAVARAISGLVESATGTVILNAVHAFLARFVALPSPEYLDAVTLWAAHAHMVEHFHTTPRLAALSPEPESGKTRVLEILDLLTPSPMLIFSPSVAAIFRKLAQEQVTLLFDEVDTVFTTRGKDDQNEDLRALLNAGYRRGASIPRCVGPKHDVVDFKVFAAVALAGIGDLPDTITTRSIVIRMRRRSATEHIEQFRLRLHESEGHQLRERLALWARSVGPRVGSAWPQLPEGVVDRRAEAWEPLIAVADAAGGGWPDRARGAAVADVAAHRGREPSLGIRLLMDLRKVFGWREGEPYKWRETVPTEEILRILHEMDESPWGDLRGKPLDSRGLAMRLRKYGVTSKNLSLGTSRPKGYDRGDLHGVWERYIPSHPIGAATSATNATNEAYVRPAQPHGTGGTASRCGPSTSSEFI